MAPITILLFAIFGIFSIESAKLNAPKVLLPFYSSVIANFTLQVEYSPEEAQIANCYRWRSTRPEVAQVQLVNSTDGTCAQTVVVSAISKTSHQMTTVVLAENKVTGEILRTNVIVGEIVRVDIETTTRLLYLEDSPEELIARGYDSEGNIFSNLEGLSFEWNLISDNETGHDVIDAHNILRIKVFGDSHYTTPRHIAPLEDRGLQGDTILVEGIRTGSAKVSARLRDAFYKTVRPSEVRIMVIANLILSPPDAYVLKHATVKYKVELLRHNSLKEIRLPHKQYYLDIKDPDICRLDVTSSLATAKVMGSTEVVLKDRNVVVTEFFRQPSAMLHVVAPGFLAFVVLPHRKWVLEAGREYDIIIEIYDTDSHKIFPSDNVRVEALFPSAYLQVLHSSVNGTHHRVKALKRGETIIDGSLVSVMDQAGVEHSVSPEVRRSQDVEIYDPVTVTPANAIFPWDPVSRCVHSLEAKALGGSGEYVWSSADASVASVNIKGQITTAGKGEASITAADAKNSAHFGLAAISVLPPADLSFAPAKVEAAVGSQLVLPLSVFAKVKGSLQAFTDCRMLPLNITFTDSAVFQLQVKDEDTVTVLPDTGCTSLTFLALRQGHTEVTATFTSKGVHLQASITVAAYNPLRAVDPETEVVVALGASTQITFLGGPQPWVLDSSRYKEDLTPAQQGLVSVGQSAPVAVSRGVHSFTVTCMDFGEQEVTLSVGNGKTAKNIYPVTEAAAIRFACAQPVELHLQPSLTLDPSLPPCPVASEQNSLMPVHCHKDLDILVSITDSSGRRFSNISSLVISWAVSAPKLGQLMHEQVLRSEITTEPSGRRVPSSHQTLRPSGQTGALVITASVESYRSAALKAIAKSSVAVNPVIRKSLELELVEEAVLSPSSVSVFNHPSNVVNIGISHGSGHFYIEEMESQILKAAYSQGDRGIKVTPIMDGTQSFTVYDLCLAVTTHPVASVSVSGVGSVQVKVIDKVEVGKEVRAEVQVLDLKGRPLLASFFSLMGLTLESGSDLVSLRPAQEGDSVTGVYTVHGARVGHTTLKAKVSLPGGQELHSPPKPLEVFPPLRLQPQNITLIIGAELQVLAFGGPQPQSSIQFSIVDSVVSLVSSGGMLEAKGLGLTRVIGQAVGTDPDTGESVVYSQDEATVNVVTLRGIRIYTPLTRLQTGTVMPVYAMGLTDHETPFTFGTSNPPLTFNWSSSSKDVVQLQSVFKDKGLSPPATNNFAQRVVTKQTGRATLRLEVKAKEGSKLQIAGGRLTDDEQIQVFEALALLSPSVCDGQMMITPGTDATLKTNRDIGARVTYTVVGEEGSTSPLVSLLDKGQLRSGSRSGTALLKVTAQEEFGLNQTMVILVKVKPVSYLMLNVDTAFQTRGESPLTSVPLGARLQLTVSYHDDVGQAFYATSVQLGLRLNRQDVLHVTSGSDNTTLLLRAAQVGSAVLKVWDKSLPSRADYIHIPVGPAVEPSQARVTLGSVVCFTSSILPDTTSPWSSRGGALEVNAGSGVGVAGAVGRGTVVFTFSGTATSTELMVDPISSLSVTAPVNFLSNQGKSRGSFFPVSLGLGPSIQGHNCSSRIQQTSFAPAFLPFTCHLTLTDTHSDLRASDLVLATPTFDSDRGQHGCQVSLTNNMPESASTFDTAVILQARTVNIHGQPAVESPSLSLDFLPGFQTDPPELSLSTAAPRGLLRVSGSPRVLAGLSVSASAPLLQTATPERGALASSLVIPVTLVDLHALWERPALDLWVEVSHTVTGQKVKVPVHVKLVGQKPQGVTFLHRDLSWTTILTSAAADYQSWFVICFIVLLTAAAVIIGYHAIVGKRFNAQANMNNSNVFLNTSGSRPASPSSSFLQHSTPVVGGVTPSRASPSSPKLWSVSYNQHDAMSPYKRKTFSYSPTS